MDCSFYYNCVFLSRVKCPIDAIEGKDGRMSLAAFSTLRVAILSLARSSCVALSLERPGFNRGIWAIRFWLSKVCARTHGSQTRHNYLQTKEIAELVETTPFRIRTGLCQYPLHGVKQRLLWIRSEAGRLKTCLQPKRGPFVQGWFASQSGMWILDGKAFG